MKKILNSQLLLMLLSILIFTGCEEKEPVIEEVEPTLAQIVMSPSALYLNDSDTVTIYLSMQPNKKHSWFVSSKPEWIEIGTQSGEIDDDILEIKVISKPGGLAVGNHKGAIEVITNGAGKAVMEVQLYVQARPELKVTSTPVIFEETDVQKKFIVSNEGTGFLNWNFKNNSIPWLYFDLDSANLAEGVEIEVTAFINRDSLKVPGVTQVHVPFKSNAIAGDTAVFFDIAVPEISSARIAHFRSMFNYSEDKDTVVLINSGNIPLEWSISDIEDYLTSNVTSGTVAVGDTTNIEIAIDRTNLEEGLTSTSFEILYSSGNSLTVPVSIYDYKEQKTLIDGQVIDAEYDKDGEMVILVSSSPNELIKFNPTTKTSSSVKLNMYPYCVSVSRDGKYAAVGHDGRFSYIDLENMAIITTEQVQFKISDLVISPNNDWIYAFSNTGSSSSNNYASYDIASDFMTYGRSYYYNYIKSAKLHPTGDRIYVTESGTYNQEWLKLDISGGALTNIGRYDADNNIGERIWISDDGEKILGQSGIIFTSSSNINSDMKYYGTLQRPNESGSYLMSFDYNSTNNIAAGIFGNINSYSSNNMNIVAFYDSEYLQKQSEVKLPSFFKESTSGGFLYKSEGQFGFFNTAGTQFHVVLKKEGGNFPQEEWAITTIDVE